MSGADIIGGALRADEPVTDVVALGSIKGGRLPEGVTLPALLVRTTSVVDRQPLKRAGFNRRTDRVSVTVRAASYAEQVAIIKLVRAACAGRLIDIGGGRKAAVQPAGVGPDVGGPANTFEQTADFRVSFDAPA